MSEGGGSGGREEGREGVGDIHAVRDCEAHRYSFLVKMGTLFC